MATIQFTTNGDYDAGNSLSMDDDTSFIINYPAPSYAMYLYYGFTVASFIGSYQVRSTTGVLANYVTDGVFADFSDKVVTTSLAGGLKGDVLIGGTAADYLNGNPGDDSLTGNAGDDMLIGGVGADTLDGGVGSDTASYETSGAAVTANLADPSLNTGDAFGDTYVSIENLRGSAGDDTLTGNAGDNVLEGGAGADTLDGGAGFNTASYANAASGVTVDQFQGSSGNDATGDTFTNIQQIIGSAYDDRFFILRSFIIEGGAGSDLIQNVAGLFGISDVRVIASYEHSAAGVQVDLSGTTSNTGGDAQDDALFNVSGVIGSSFADRLIAAGTGSTLEGNGGLDTITGGDGNDIISVIGNWASISGGNGTADRFEIHANGATEIVAAASSVSGIERTVIFDGARVDLGTLTTDVGTIKVVGAGAEVTGTQVADQITGGAGADTIVGGDGADLLRGGAGADTFVYRNEGDLGTVGAERIFGFSGHAGDGDRIDLSALGVVGVQEGRFTATGEAQIRVIAGENGSSTVTFDFDGDGARDALLRVRGDAPLTAGDFTFAKQVPLAAFVTDGPGHAASDANHLSLVGAGHPGGSVDALTIQLV